LSQAPRKVLRVDLLILCSRSVLEAAMEEGSLDPLPGAPASTPSPAPEDSAALIRTHSGTGVAAFVGDIAVAVLGAAQRDLQASLESFGDTLPLCARFAAEPACVLLVLRKESPDGQDGRLPHVLG
jgi:hypothetical protein